MIDETDRRILRVLQDDGRITNSELATRVHLSESACLRRVRRLEGEGVISGYVTLIDQAAIGRPTDVFVEITLTDQNEDTLDAFEAAVREAPEIMFCTSCRAVRTTCCMSLQPIRLVMSVSTARGSRACPVSRA